MLPNAEDARDAWVQGAPRTQGAADVTGSLRRGQFEACLQMYSVACRCGVEHTHQKPKQQWLTLASSKSAITAYLVLIWGRR